MEAGGEEGGEGEGGPRVDGDTNECGDGEEETGVLGTRDDMLIGEGGCV